MEFFAQPAFFVLLAASIVPAAILGICQKRIRVYGLAVSVLFLLLLFAKDITSLACLAFFVLLSTAVTFIYQWIMLRRSEQPARLEQPAQPARPEQPAQPAQLEQSVRFKRAAAVVFRVGLVLLLAPIICYKCSAVFNQNILGFLGISYITFKSVQVFLEIHDGVIKKLSLFDYLYFLLFFAPFTSGPIDRSRRFTADAKRPLRRQEYLQMLVKGILLLLVGVVYKVVIAAVIFDFYAWAPSRATTALLDIAVLIKNAYCYGFYLFFDFAGYSLMAMGASYCFGIRTPRNFKAPFVSTDIKDFWNRWHITLSFWLRDFVFMRFTRAAVKRKWFSSRVTTACLGYLLNMSLMGLWHGLTAQYLVYGIYHGLLLAATEVYQKRSSFYKRHKNKHWYKVLSWAVTINLVTLGFAIFAGQVF